MSDGCTLRSVVASEFLNRTRSLLCFLSALRFEHWIHSNDIYFAHLLTWNRRHLDKVSIWDSHENRKMIDTISAYAQIPHERPDFNVTTNYCLFFHLYNPFPWRKSNKSKSKLLLRNSDFQTEHDRKHKCSQNKTHIHSIFRLSNWMMH